MKTDPAQIGHFIKSGFMGPRIKAVFKQAKVVGPAFTIRIPVNDSAMIYYAMQKAPKGSVIVIDRQGDGVYACAGEIVVLAAKSLGMAGIVVDGPSTDSIAIEEIGFPVFSTGLSPVTTTLLGLTGEYDLPVQCGGTVVNPGDIVFGDADGVIVIPPERVEELVEKAENADSLEDQLKKHMENGGYVTDFLNINKLVETDKEGYFSELKKLDK
jgi:regulator of RNase E activity RraA